MQTNGSSFGQPKKKKKINNILKKKNLGSEVVRFPYIYWEKVIYQLELTSISKSKL